jgi:hypothetical protein
LRGVVPGTSVRGQLFRLAVKLTRKRHRCFRSFSGPRCVSTKNGVSHPTAPSEQRVHSKVSFRRAVDAVQRCGVGRVFEPTTRVWRSGTTRKQPANLAVEGAEESLTILPDSTPTVRPPPKRVLTISTETCLKRLTCSRTATVVCMVSGMH